MKAVGLLAAGSSNGPLQELKKKAKAKKDKSADGVEDTRSSKRDPVKEYMEQQFYKQFLPKRDFNSRIRKLALDKDTLRRAQGNSKKEVFIAAADRLGTHNGNQTAQKTVRKKPKQKSKKQKTKRGPPPKTKKEICSMVSELDALLLCPFCCSTVVCKLRHGMCALMSLMPAIMLFTHFTVYMLLYMPVVCLHECAAYLYYYFSGGWCFPYLPLRCVCTTTSPMRTCTPGV